MRVPAYPLLPSTRGDQPSPTSFMMASATEHELSPNRGEVRDDMYYDELSRRIGQENADTIRYFDNVQWTSPQAKKRYPSRRRWEIENMQKDYEGGVEPEEPPKEKEQPVRRV
jgi:hypothetical protein